MGFLSSYVNFLVSKEIDDIFSVIITHTVLIVQLKEVIECFLFEISIFIILKFFSKYLLEVFFTLSICFGLLLFARLCMVPHLCHQFHVFIFIFLFIFVFLFLLLFVLFCLIMVPWLDFFFRLSILFLSIFFLLFFFFLPPYLLESLFLVIRLVIILVLVVRIGSRLSAP